MHFTPTIDKEPKIIGAIPYGTAVESFLALLSFAPSVTMTVYTGESVNTGTVQSGDILKVSAEGEEKETYTLQVVAPSADNTIVSVGAYTLEGETIKNVPYGTTLDEFKSNITLPFGATAVYPYADDYQGAIENNMEFRVVAQNGAEKVYTVQVNPGRSDSALESDVYTVDPVALSIGKVKVGTDVGEFLANIRASEGGEIRLMDSKMQQMTAGQLTGGESVRVYPEDPVPGKAYTAYVIQYEEEKQILEETIITLQDSSCVLTGDWLESSSAVEPGYGPITLPKYLNGAGSAVFTPEITQAGVYDVYIYTSYHSSNPAVTMKVMQGETELGNALIDFAQPSGWKLVGSYELPEGAQVSLVYDGNRLSESGFARFSAARFARADLLEMEKVTLQVNESNYDLKSGISVSGVLPEPGEVQITFPAEMDEKTLENIALVSENGYPIDCGRSYDAESKTYTMTTAYSLVRGVAYYLQIPSTVKTAAGSSLSAPYMYQMNTMPKEYDATAQIIYYRDGAVASSTIGGAVKAKVNLSFGNHTDGEKTAQVFVAYYGSNKLGAIEMLSITAAADGSGKGECEIDFQHAAQESDKLKVFVWDGENAPLAEVVYTK